MKTEIKKSIKRNSSSKKIKVTTQESLLKAIQFRSLDRKGWAG